MQVAAGLAQELPLPQVFTILFLMLGPFKVIGPYAQLTEGMEPRQAHRIAALALAFASAALLVAALLGSSILESYGVPVPVMALAGGLILFLVALQGLLAQFQGQPANVPAAAPVPAAKLAMSPLAFPTLVTPYGIAALVVMMALSSGPQERLAIGGIVAGIMLANLVIMMVARRILPVMGVILPVLGAVLGVVQVALGLQIINNALHSMGIL